MDVTTSREINETALTAPTNTDSPEATGDGFVWGLVTAVGQGISYCTESGSNILKGLLSTHEASTASVPTQLTPAKPKSYLDEIEEKEVYPQISSYKSGTLRGTICQAGSTEREDYPGYHLPKDISSLCAALYSELSKGKGKETLNQSMVVIEAHLQYVRSQHSVEERQQLEQTLESLEAQYKEAVTARQSDSENRDYVSTGEERLSVQIRPLKAQLRRLNEVEKLYKTVRNHLDEHCPTIRVNALKKFCKVGDISGAMKQLMQTPNMEKSVFNRDQMVFSRNGMNQQESESYDVLDRYKGDNPFPLLEQLDQILPMQKYRNSEPDLRAVRTRLSQYMFVISQMGMFSELRPGLDDQMQDTLKTLDMYIAHAESVRKYQPAGKKSTLEAMVKSEEEKLRESKEKADTQENCALAMKPISEYAATKMKGMGAPEESVFFIRVTDEDGGT